THTTRASTDAGGICGSWTRRSIDRSGWSTAASPNVGPPPSSTSRVCDQPLRTAQFLTGRRERSSAGEREMHVVLQGVPVAAPLPPDPGEGANHDVTVVDHPFPLE